jgi:nitronate monooxygenase
LNAISLEEFICIIWKSHAFLQFGCFSHGVRRDLANGTLSLTGRLVKLAHTRKRKIPVLAAGGIVDGRGVTAALGLGADGVVLGTRLWASIEAKGPNLYKEALVKARSCDDVVRTEVFDMIRGSCGGIEWPAPYDSSGVLRNDMTDKWDNRLPQLSSELLHPSAGLNIAKKFQYAVECSDPSSACVYSGQGVGEISAVEPAYELVKRIEKEAVDSLFKLQSVVLPCGS